MDSAPGMEEIRDGTTAWRFDRDFFRSNWTCIWGRGCLGIEDEPDPESGRGCCSVGAVFVDQDEARLTAALAATLPGGLWQHAGDAEEGGIWCDDERSGTRVVDGACIFLNRPGFEGGAGCALHLAALADGTPPGEWKPAVCSELPIKVDWEEGPDGTETATVRRWTRGDWGDEGATMAWCCTEGERAYVGTQPVVDSLAPELTAIVGHEVWVELRARIVDR